MNKCFLAAVFLLLAACGNDDPTAGRRDAGLVVRDAGDDDGGVSDTDAGEMLTMPHPGACLETEVSSLSGEKVRRNFYDRKRRLAGVYVSIDGGPESLVYTYLYDDVGRLVRMTEESPELGEKCLPRSIVGFAYASTGLAREIRRDSVATTSMCGTEADGAADSITTFTDGGNSATVDNTHTDWLDTRIDVAREENGMPQSIRHETRYEGSDSYEPSVHMTLDLSGDTEDVSLGLLRTELGFVPTVVPREQGTTWTGKVILEIVKDGDESCVCEGPDGTPNVRRVETWVDGKRVTVRSYFPPSRYTEVTTSVEQATYDERGNVLRRTVDTYAGPDIVTTSTITYDYSCW